MIECIK